MFGSSKKREENNGSAGGAIPGKQPLKLREDAPSLKEPDPQPPQEVAHPTGTPPARKPKLHLMTSAEEHDRSYQSAREHYLLKTLPEIKKEHQEKKRSDAWQGLVDRLIASIGFFLLACAGFWAYNNTEVIGNWWKTILDSLKFI